MKHSQSLILVHFEVFYCATVILVARVLSLEYSKILEKLIDCEFEGF